MAKDGRSLAELISERQPGRALEQRFYTDAAIYELELERVVYRNWIVAGHASELPEPGDFKTFNVGRESAILVRGGDGELRAFANVCRHRGSLVCLESHGNTDKFMCPYHGWLYDIDGKLVAARSVADDFDKGDWGLEAVSIDTIGGLILVCFSDNPPGLDGARTDLAEPMAEIGRLVLAGGKRLRPAFCHWGFVAAGGDADRDEPYEMLDHALARLSRSERKVAEWVLAHPRETTKSTVAAVALAAQTSEPTVIRFCRSMGLRGFRDFTLRLAESLSRPESLVHRDVSNADTTNDATVKVLDAGIRALVELRSVLAEMPFEPVVRQMVHARQFVFAGLGASGHVAADATHKFFRLGIPCSAITESPSIRQFAAIAGSGDVLFLISKTGHTEVICEAARVARENGALGGKLVGAGGGGLAVFHLRALPGIGVWGVWPMR